MTWPSLQFLTKFIGLGLKPTPPSLSLRNAKVDHLVLALIFAVGSLAYLLMKDQSVEVEGDANGLVDEAVQAADLSRLEWPDIDSIDIAHHFEEGEWTLLVYHHQDPDCSNTLHRYQRLAERLQEKGKNKSRAALERSNKTAI